MNEEKFTKHLLHYDVMASFHEVFYSDKITEEHIMNEGRLVRLDKLVEPSSEEEYNFWGWQFRKGSKVYLLSLYDDKNNEIDLKKILPLKINSERKVAHQKEVFHEVVDWSTAKYRPIKHYTLKKVVELLTSIEHSNMKHAKLNMMMELTGYFYGFCSRKATPPSFGKDSTTQLFNTLFGKFHVITTPSLPKFQYEISICKKLVLTELGSWPKAFWNQLEPTLLNVADGKPTVQKNTRAGFGVGDTINIYLLSLDMFYNDIDRYPDTKKYLDYIGNDAIPDRFIPFRFFGRVTENFTDWKAFDPKKVAMDNLEEYRKIIESIEYYKQNISKEINDYDKNNIEYPDMKVRSRWMNQLSKLLNVVNVCSSNQSEFDAWCTTISKSITDYSEMLMYPKHLPSFYSKLGIPKSASEKFSEVDINDSVHYLNSLLKGNEEQNKKVYNKIDYIKKIVHSDTFTEKNKLMIMYSDIDSEVKINDAGVKW